MSWMVSKVTVTDWRINPVTWGRLLAGIAVVLYGLTVIEFLRVH